jgi:hypothetical protein
MISFMALVMTSAVVWGVEPPQPATSTQGLGFEFIKKAKFGIFVHDTAPSGEMFAQEIRVEAMKFIEIDFK